MTHIVIVDYARHSENFPCASFSIALTVAKLAHRDHPGRVRVISDEAEGGYGDDGTEFRDGLTQAEKDALEEAGIHA